MNFTPSLTIAAAATTTESPDVENETPPQISNRRHRHLALPQPTMATYRECLKNHAASFGGFALDGCGEFMPSLTSSLKCAACGCHRNFHRRRHHHHYPRLHSSWLQLQSQQSPSPSPTCSRSPSPTTSASSPTPLPISHLPPPYYASAPRVLLSLNSGGGGGYSCPLEEQDPNAAKNPNGRKRMRSKFSHEQKARMQRFAEKMGWRLPKNDERLVEEFCDEIGIDKRVFKIWIHNNKQSMMKGEKLFNHNNNGVKDGNNNGESGGRESLIDAIADKAGGDRNEGTNYGAFLNGSSSSS